MTKFACFTDIHFGKQGNSREHNERCLSFVKWFCIEARKAKADAIVFLGDWHDNRNTIGVETLHYSSQAVSALCSVGIPVYVVVGNHDMPYRDTRRASSVSWMAGITAHGTSPIIIDSPQIHEAAYFLPYIVPGDDITDIAKKARNCEFVFGHLELPGFFMNEKFAMPHVDGHITADDFVGPRWIFSGHFHSRQISTTKSGAKVCYMGNCFPHDFSDADDHDRGMMLIETGGDPTFLTWPEQPTFHRLKASDIHETIGSLGPNATVRITQDVTLGLEEKEMLQQVAAELGLVKMTIEPIPREDPETGQVWDGRVDLDTFVLSWIANPDNTKEIGDADPIVMARLFTEAGR